MNKKLLSIGLIALLYISHTIAQKQVKINYKDYSELTGVTKADVKLIKAADEIYLEGLQDFEKASLPLYLQAYNHDSLNYDPLDWRIAMCYMYSSNKSAALDYILRCDSTISNLYFYYLGKAYQFDGQFVKAKENYGVFANQFLDADEKTFYKTFDQKALKYPIKSVVQTLEKACDRALLLTSDSILTTVINLKIINSEYDEAFPFFKEEGQIVFSSNKVEGTSKTNSFKIYSLEYDSLLDFSFPKLCDSYPNDDQDNISAAPYYEDMSSYVLYQSMLSGNGDIMVLNQKKKKASGYLFPKINSSSEEGMACFIGVDTIVFSSDRNNKDGMGDLYMSFKDVKGKWVKPFVLTGDINTSADEEVITYYNRELYFVSNNSSRSIGGYDIFKASYLGNNQWGEVVNLGYPINTADNDMGYYPIDSTQGLYFGVRSSGVGGTDIYRVTQEVLKKVDTVVVDTLISTPIVHTIADYDSLMMELSDSLVSGASDLDTALINESKPILDYPTPETVIVDEGELVTPPRTSNYSPIED